MAVLFLPFGYPGYPSKELSEHINESREYLKSIGVDFVDTNDIILLDNCEQAVEKAKTDVWDCVIVLIASWIEAPNVLRVLSAAQLEDTPMLLWSHDNVYDSNENAIISFGAIASAGVMRETFEEFGYKFKFVVGNPYDDVLTKDILNFYNASVAVRKLKCQRLGMIGYASMGMYTGLADPIKVKRYFGTEIVQLDQYSLISQIHNMELKEIQETSEALKNEWSLSEKIEEDQINRSSAILLRLNQLVEENKLDAVTVKCQYEMSIEYGFTPCVALSLLGGRIPTSCEGDVYLLLSQMVLSNITNQTTTYGDILSFLDDGIICAACGFAPKCFLSAERPAIDKHTALYSGMLITTPFKSQPVTVIRLANDAGGFKMHLIKGHTEELHGFHEIGCPAYAGSVIRFENKTVEDFRDEVMSQHYAIVAGDHIEALKDFCNILNIRVV